MQYRNIKKVLLACLPFLFFNGQSAFTQQNDSPPITNSTNRKRQIKADPKWGLFVFTGMQGGVMHPRGRLANQFVQSDPGMLVYGLRWHRFRVAVRGERLGKNASDLYTGAFVDSSGYRRESLSTSASSLSMLIGYEFVILRTLSVGPFVALEWRRIIEGNLPFDPHPNWSLDGHSRSQPAVGLEFSYHGSLNKDAWTHREQRSFLSLNMGMQVSRVRYDNPEYENGTMLFLYFGIGYEFRLIY